jgi:hypothetical protein
MESKEKEKGKTNNQVEKKNKIKKQTQKVSKI